MNDRRDPNEDGAAEQVPPEQVPPGRAGADSGAVDLVRVDPDGIAEIPDRSHANDTPGVGPREPDQDPAYDLPSDEEFDAYYNSRPNTLSDETGGAPHLLKRERPAPHADED